MPEHGSPVEVVVDIDTSQSVARSTPMRERPVPLYWHSASLPRGPSGLPNEPVEKVRLTIFTLFSGVILPFPIMRSSIVAPFTRPLFSVSHKERWLRTFPTGSIAAQSRGTLSVTLVSRRARAVGNVAVNAVVRLCYPSPYFLPYSVDLVVRYSVLQQFLGMPLQFVKYLL